MIWGYSAQPRRGIGNDNGNGNGNGNGTILLDMWR
jgi:hypothetical protein